jgi:hypothetical protein
MSNEQKEKHPVVEVAHVVNEDSDNDGIVKLSTGYEARILPVSASLIDQVTARVKDPLVPMWMNDQKGREEPNPADPVYIQAMDDAARERGIAAMDALIMFGVELVEPIPEDTLWIKKLQYLGIEVDVEDTFEVEFYFKKYVAVSAEDVTLVTRRSGMSAEEVAEAERSFRRSAT